MSFKEINANELQLNPFTKIGGEWLLITAGTEDKFNTMTASWGGMGVNWGKNVITTYIRPQRYTKEFVDSNDTFTVSFFPAEYKKALSVCGSVSGRDTNKVKECGLTPCFVEGTVSFEEAELIFVCRKMYQGEIFPSNFIDKEAEKKWYPEKDYHVMYISEVVKVLVKQ